MRRGAEEQLGDDVDALAVHLADDLPERRRRDRRDLRRAVGHGGQARLAVDGDARFLERRAKRAGGEQRRIVDDE